MGLPARPTPRRAARPPRPATRLASHRDRPRSAEHFAGCSSRIIRRNGSGAGRRQPAEHFAGCSSRIIRGALRGVCWSGGTLDSACQTALSWTPGPAAQSQHGTDLAGHPAGIADDVPPAVPECGVTSDGRDVVPLHVPERRTRRVCLPAIEFDDDMPWAVTNVAVPVTTASSVLHLVPGARREAMPLLYISSEGEFQVRGHTDLNLGQDLEQERAPPLARTVLHAVSEPIRGRHPALRCSQHEIDCYRRGDSVTVIQDGLFDPQARWLRRRVNQSLRRVEGTPAVHPEARLSMNSAGFRNDNVDNGGRLVGQLPQPQCGAMTRRGAASRVEDGCPHSAMSPDRAGECCVDTWQYWAPASGVDVRLCLRRGEIEVEELAATDDAALNLGGGRPSDSAEGGGWRHGAS